MAPTLTVWLDQLTSLRPEIYYIYIYYETLVEWQFIVIPVESVHLQVPTLTSIASHLAANQVLV